MLVCSAGPTCPSAPATASARFTCAWPRSRLAVSRLVSVPDSDTLLDARLLVDVALHFGLHALRRRGIRIVRLRIVLLTVDISAHLVLRSLEPRLFRRA